MILFKVSADASEDSTGLTENQLKNYTHQILRNPEMNLSKLGFFLISGGFDKSIKVWDFSFQKDDSPGYPSREFSGHSNWITNILSLEDGENVVSGDDNGEIIIWVRIFNRQMA
jgi:WD40 repeat protein